VKVVKIRMAKDTSSGFKSGIVAVVILLLLVCGAFWYRGLHAVPSYSYTSHPLPSPNAFDYYAGARSKVKVFDQFTIGFAVNNDVRIIPLKRVSSSVNRKYSLAEKEAILARNAGALAVARQGLKYDYWNPPVRTRIQIVYSQVKLFGIMSVVQLFLLDGQVKAGHKDWGGAMSSDLDAVQMIEDQSRGTPIYLQADTMNTQDGNPSFRSMVWQPVQHLNAQQAKDSVRRMEEICSRHVSFVDRLQTEKSNRIATTASFFRQRPGWRTDLWRKSFGPELSMAHAPVFERIAAVRSLFSSNESLLNMYSNYMDQYIKNAGQPYGAMPVAAPTLPNNKMFEFLCSGSSEDRFMYTKLETENSLLLLSLALRAYKLERGSYPAKLADLSPSYLKTIPDDPFSNRKPFKYRLNGNSYTLYSIGPDLKDDGGTFAAGNIATYTKGDLEAGNTWR
jgi:hypothetical protein